MPQSYRERVRDGRVEMKLLLDADIAARLKAVARKHSRYASDVVYLALIRYLRDTAALDADLADREIRRPLRRFRAGHTKPKKTQAHQWSEHPSLRVRVCSRCDLVWSRRLSPLCDPERERLMEDVS